MATPLFSVVVPTYNRATCLTRCLDALVAQTFEDFEVIVCDDGSTDNSRDVVSEFAARLNIQYFWNAHWGGPARPRNVGVRKARTDWICFLDSDDWWYPSKLAACLPHLDEHDVVFHRLDVVTPRGSSGRSVGRELRHPAFVDLLTNLNAIPNSGAMARRALLLGVDGFSEDPGIVGAEDFDLWVRLSRRTERFRQVPEILGAYLDAGAGHNLSAGDAQIQNERRVFERYRDGLSSAQLLEAQRNWDLRRDLLRGGQ